MIHSLPIEVLGALWGAMAGQLEGPWGGLSGCEKEGGKNWAKFGEFVAHAVHKKIYRGLAKIYRALS